MMIDDVRDEYLADAAGDYEAALLLACRDVMRLRNLTGQVSAGYTRRVPVELLRAPKQIAPHIEDPKRD